MNFPFVQSSCFYNNLFHRNLFLIAILITRQNFFSLIFQGLKHDTWPCWCLQRSPEAGSGTWILPKPNKVISILTETLIKYTIQETIDWTPSFSLLEIVIQKKCFLCFIWVLKVSEADTDPLCPLRLLPLLRVLCFCPFRV